MNFKCTFLRLTSVLVVFLGLGYQVEAAEQESLATAITSAIDLTTIANETSSEMPTTHQRQRVLVQPEVGVDFLFVLGVSVKPTVVVMTEAH